MTNSSNKVLYIGVTNNLQRRVYEHKNKLNAGFTTKYNTNKLVYWEEFSDVETAISREKTMKNLVRRKKNSLIDSTNPNWKDLYSEIL